jgi:hypothetical protein
VTSQLDSVVCREIDPQSLHCGQVWRLRNSILDWNKGICIPNIISSDRVNAELALQTELKSSILYRQNYRQAYKFLYRHYYMLSLNGIYIYISIFVGRYT